MKTLVGLPTFPTRLLVLAAVLTFCLAACSQRGDVPAVQTAPAPVDIGYGEVGSDQVTGAVTATHSDAMDGVQAPTLATMLAQLPGVRVVHSTKLHGGLEVRIRGSSNSFQTSQEPLFVLDGMPIPSGDGKLFGIDPNTIETITMLKDAGATAIYGSRGANGVILIKTKGGGDRSAGPASPRIGSGLLAEMCAADRACWCRARQPIPTGLRLGSPGAPSVPTGDPRSKAPESWLSARLRVTRKSGPSRLGGPWTLPDIVPVEGRVTVQGGVGLSG